MNKQKLLFLRGVLSVKSKNNHNFADISNLNYLIAFVLIAEMCQLRNKQPGNWQLLIL